MKPRIYISGGITGIHDNNKPAFQAAAIALRSAGFDPVNPQENGVPDGAPWISHMRADIVMMMSCEGVATLDGWERSRGANVEVDLALSLGMRVDRVDAWVQIAT